MPEDQKIPHYESDSEKYKILLLCAFIIILFIASSGGLLFTLTFFTIIGSLFFQKGRKFLASLGTLKPESFMRATVIIIGGVALYILIITVLNYFFPVGEIEDIYDQGNNQTIGGLLFAIFLGGMAAILEEVIMRGFLLTRLLGVFGNSQTSQFFIVLITSVIFGAGHIYQGGFWPFVHLTIFSLLLATIFLKTNFNLGYVIAIHLLYNTISSIALYMGW